MRSMSKRLSLAALVTLAAIPLLADAPSARAADKPEANPALADPEPWRLGFTAYGWLTSISGSSAIVKNAGMTFSAATHL